VYIKPHPTPVHPRSGCPTLCAPCKGWGIAKPPHSSTHRKSCHLDRSATQWRDPHIGCCLCHCPCFCCRLFFAVIPQRSGGLSVLAVALAVSVVAALVFLSVIPAGNLLLSLPLLSANSAAISQPSPQGWVRIPTKQRAESST